MKTYKIDLLSSTDVSMMRNVIIDITKLFTNKEFHEFILQKCQLALDTICSMNMPFPEDLDTLYMTGMKTRISDNEIELYNDSEIDISSKNMKETTKAKYPSKLSLAKMIEYGIGYQGTTSILQSEIEDWELDVNNHGISGWYYYDDSGNLIWTNGFEGKYIFFKLAEHVEQNISLWIDEYLEKNINI